MSLRLSTQLGSLEQKNTGTKIEGVGFGGSTSGPHTGEGKA
jgi:hypothetical protein